ncbi:MAG: 4'-phosphopantetheinyl transferase superfamily protein [Oscillospiraceae bacterium]|jgi:4'-phosphopantetheinyl transferase|nr:4'-phosphopantetheinyl transferase superfamily protein [Oscillospiraceae bacterium]
MILRGNGFEVRTGNISPLLDDAEFLRALGRLPAQWRGAVLRYGPPRRRAQSLMCRCLLLEALAERGTEPPDILFSPEGKPYFQEGAPDFSLSHSGDLAAAAISERGRIGIDIERMRTVDSRILKREFSAAERERVCDAADGAAEIMRIWTGKECVLKARGAGKLSEIETGKLDICCLEIEAEYILSVFCAD